MDCVVCIGQIGILMIGRRHQHRLDLRQGIARKGQRLYHIIQIRGVGAMWLDDGQDMRCVFSKRSPQYWIETRDIVHIPL